VLCVYPMLTLSGFCFAICSVVSFVFPPYPTVASSVPFSIFPTAVSQMWEPDKPLCSAEQIGVGGTWREMSQREVQSWNSPKERHCKFNFSNEGRDAYMVYTPSSDCVLPALQGHVDVKSKHVRFLGDSLSRHSAQAFYSFTTSEYHYAVERWPWHLLDGPYKCNVSAAAIHNILSGGNLSKASITWAVARLSTAQRVYGCGTNVSYIPMATAWNVSQGFMDALVTGILYSGTPLGPEDVLVVNWGLWPGAVLGLTKFMRSFVKIAERKGAPRLIWRQTSPSHWPGGGDFYPGAHVATQCVPRERESEANYSHVDRAPHKSDSAFFAAAQAAGLAVDGMRVAFLPIFRASVARHEEHPISHFYNSSQVWRERRALGGTSRVDCTHYCLSSSVFRFWTSSLVSTIHSMVKRR